jgi:predicted SAM-dependent methyltransferase
MNIKQHLRIFVLRFFPINQRTLFLLRREFVSILLNFISLFDIIRHYKIHALKKCYPISLNIGSGGMGIPGWINTDIVYSQDSYIRLDIRQKLPFKDNSTQRIFAEHVIEHIDFRYDVPVTFSEFHRILTPGGVLRIIVPDAKMFLQAYVNNDSSLWKELNWDPEHLPDDIYTQMHVINHIFHQQGEHFFGYDYETLEYALKKAGFSKIYKSSYKQSEDKELNLDSEGHKKYSLYVEAVK